MPDVAFSNRAPGFPQRTIPIALKCRTLANTAVLVGAVLFAVGLIVAVYLSPLRTSMNEMALGRSNAQTLGVATASEETNTRVNEQEVYRIFYRFSAPDGRTFIGQSYSRAQRPANGASVHVEYLPDNPSVSRIRGMSMNIAPPWVPLMFFVPGLLILVGGLVWGLRRLVPLRMGMLAPATVRTCQLLSSEDPEPVLSLEQFQQRCAAAASDNRLIGKMARIRRVRCTFDFPGPDGQTVEASDDITYNVSQPLDPAQELVLYDPANPKSALLVRGLPLRLAIGPSGELQMLDRPHHSVLRAAFVVLLLVASISWFLAS